MQRQKQAVNASGVAASLVGLQLADAFVKARSAGFKLNVHAIDGKTVNDPRTGINVNTFDSIVRKSWVN